MSSAKEDLARFKSEGDVNISSQRKDWARKNIDPETERWLAEDAKYFLHQALSTPCLNVLSHCDGIYIEDLQGKRYMDFHGNSVHQVGFGNRQVIEAIKEQMDDLSFCTRRYTNIPAIKLAKKLVELAPGDLNRVLFAPGGTVAIGMALKLARAATGRFKTISMWDSFHGASLDVISIGGAGNVSKRNGTVASRHRARPAPGPYSLPLGLWNGMQPQVCPVSGVCAREGGRCRRGDCRNCAEHSLHSASGILADHPGGVRSSRCVVNPG